MVGQCYSPLQQIAWSPRNRDLQANDMDRQSRNWAQQKFNHFTWLLIWMKKLNATVVPLKSSTTLSSRRATGYVKSRTIFRSNWLRPNNDVVDKNFTVNNTSKYKQNTMKQIPNAKLKCMLRIREWKVCGMWFLSCREKPMRAFRVWYWF